MQPKKSAVHGYKSCVQASMATHTCSMHPLQPAQENLLSCIDIMPPGYMDYTF